MARTPLQGRSTQNCRGSACNPCRPGQALPHNNRPVFSLPKLASSFSSSLSQTANTNNHLTFIHIFLHSLFAGAKLSTPSFDRTSLFYLPKFTQKEQKIVKATRQNPLSPHFNRRNNAIHTVPKKSSNQHKKTNTTSNST